MYSTKCEICCKPLGLYEFKCRCNKIFCLKHKQAEDHNCSYDYKEEFENLLKNKLPTTHAEKIQKF